MGNLNIVYLHAHDAGRAASPYGYPVATPNLQRFAEEGVVFRNAFSAAPTCGPSRTAMLTGAYPHEVGMFGLSGQGWLVDDYEKHLSPVLKGMGYETVLAGCQHEAHRGDLGVLKYDRILDTRAKQGEFYQETIDHVERYLAERHLAGEDQPFFLSVGLDEPHRNNIPRPESAIGGESARFSKTRYYDPDRLDSRFVAPLPGLPDLPSIRQDIASLYEGSRIMDEYMGRVIYAIDHYGFGESTLIVVTTDHGIEFPGGKKTLGDLGIGVMLMMRGPMACADGAFSGGRMVDALVSQMDVAPTLLDAIGESPRPWYRGNSLLPLLRGEEASVRDEIYCEQTYHGSLEPLRCIRTSRYKLTLRHFPTGPRMRQDGPSTQVMADAGWYDRSLGNAELYDLYLDPQEACNRIADPAYRDTAADLRRRLDAWMKETGDCFPSGEFPDIPRLQQ